MTNWIDDQWMQKAFEAMEATLKVDRDLKRDMVQFLLDEGFWDAEKLQWESAVARFNANLNPSKEDAFFKISEVWALMRRFGQHDLFLAMADDLGYEVRRKPTDERTQELLERIAIALERQNVETTGALADLARLDQPLAANTSRVLRIHPRPKFSKGSW